MDRFWSPTVKQYYGAILLAAILIDLIIEPWLGLHTYTDIWNITGITIRGDPLLVYLQYPVTAALWVAVPRAIQRLTRWRWRPAYYGGFILLALAEELFNEYVIRFWHYTAQVTWTDSFLLNLPIIIILGWLTWAVLADILATGYVTYRTHQARS